MECRQQAYTIKQQDFGFAPSEALKVRPNASPIATAAQYGVPLAQRMTAPYVWSNLHQYGRVTSDTMQLRSSRAVLCRQRRTSRGDDTPLVQLGLGLSDIQLREFELVGSDNQRQELWRPFGSHHLENGATFELDFSQESSGTAERVRICFHVFCPHSKTVASR